MKYLQLIVGRLIMPSLLALSIPLTANAEPQSEERDGHNASQHFSNEKNSGHHFRHGGGNFHFPSAIDLTESQRDQIFAIKHKQEALLYEQSKIVRKAHIDLQKLIISDQYDDEKAKAITEKLGKAIGNIKFLRAQEWHQTYALLTPEQRNLLNSHQFNRGAEHQKLPPASGN
jgi:Spy/CpxP family protein refolding chaperone